MAKWEEYDVEIEVTNTHIVRVKAQSPRHARSMAWVAYHGKTEPLRYTVLDDAEPRARKARLVRREE